MADKKINIILDTRATGDGFERTNKGLGYSKKAAEKATKASTDLTVSVQVSIRARRVTGDKLIEISNVWKLFQFAPVA